MILGSSTVLVTTGGPVHMSLTRTSRTRASRRAALVTTSWLFVTFGEHEVMAQLIAKRVLIFPLIHKDFPVRHPFLARANCASVNLNHQQ